MNIKAFKRLIKEAVSEAIYEELPEILEEVLRKQNKQALREGSKMKTFNFTSDDVPTSRLPAEVRNSLAAKMGNSMGFQQPVMPKLEVINKVDEQTGQAVNPYLAFIADAAANMTPQERSGLQNLDM